METKSGRGGARPGAGRKPKTFLYTPVAYEVEGLIADALPGIIKKLIKQAESGDLAVAKYLCDRLLGRVAVMEVPPARDCWYPESEEEALYNLKTWRPRRFNQIVQQLEQAGAKNAPALVLPQVVAVAIAGTSVSKQAFLSSGQGYRDKRYGQEPPIPGPAPLRLQRGPNGEPIDQTKLPPEDPFPGIAPALDRHYG